MDESERIQRAYSHYFDLSIVNDNLDGAYRSLKRALDRLNTDHQWVPVSWVFWEQFASWVLRSAFLTVARSPVNCCNLCELACSLDFCTKNHDNTKLVYYFVKNQNWSVYLYLFQRSSVQCCMFVIPVRVGLYICIETVEYVLAPYVTMKIFRIMLDVSMLYDYVVFCRDCLVLMY